MAISRIDLTPMTEAIANAATILVPSLRIKDAILAEIHSKESRRSYPTTVIDPIDVWIKEMWHLMGIAGVEPCCNWQLMSAVEEQFVWTQIIENSRSEVPLLNPEEAAAQVSQSYQDIRQWDLWETLIDGESHYQSNLDVETFIGWAKEYREVCLSKQLISLVDCTHELVKSFSAGNGHFLPEEILLSNFDDPPPLYRKLFESLASLTKLSSTAVQSFENIHRTLRYEFPDRDQEIKSCANWARSICKENPDAHIGIIMPSAVADKGAIIRRFDETFDHENVLKPIDKELIFNSTGDAAPLSDFAVVHDALSLLVFVFSELDSNEVCRLLQSPFLFPDGSETDSLIRAQIDARRILNSSCNAFELSNLLSKSERDAHSPKFSKALLDAKTQIRECAVYSTPREWAKLFEEILCLFEWPGKPHSLDESKLLQLWDEGLQSLGTSNTSLGKITYQQALKNFRSILKKLSPRPGFSSKRQLSLYTVSEAVGLRFDYAWLIGFDDQSWPQPSTPSPFLPYELQRKHNMPASHGENQFLVASQSYKALASNVECELVASHYKTDNDQELRASSFIKQIGSSEAPIADSWPLSAYSQMETVYSLAFHDDMAPLPLSGNEIVKGGQSVLSNQSSCPFRGFAKHRLDANPLEPFSSGLNSMARGTALHIAMEVFYSNVSDLAVLRSLSANELSKAIKTACYEAVAFLQRRYQKIMTPRFSKIEKLRLEGLLSLFIDLEKNRKDFTVIAQEKKYEWQHGNLNLTLKVDRIDQLADHSLGLIDYKTGKHTASKASWLEERPEDMQLPLYFVVASESEEKPVSTLSIAHVNIEKIDYSGLTGTSEFSQGLKPVNEDEKIDYSWEELTEYWQQRVHYLAQEFNAGKNNVHPVNDEKSCQYCGLQALCRIQTLRDNIDSATDPTIKGGQL